MAGNMAGNVPTEILRKQLMVSQFVNAVNCSTDEATQILTSSRWQIEVALSMFFQGHGVAANSSHPQPPQHQNSHCTPTASSGGSSSSSLGSRMSYQACVPTNTPATPPQFPDTLAAFAQMTASSPSDNSTALAQESPMLQCQTQASKS